MKSMNGKSAKKGLKTCDHKLARICDASWKFAEDVAIGTPVGVTPSSRATALTTQRGGSCGESMSIFCYHQVRCWSGMLEALV